MTDLTSMEILEAVDRALDKVARKFAKPPSRKPSSRSSRSTPGKVEPKEAQSVQRRA